MKPLSTRMKAALAGPAIIAGTLAGIAPMASAATASSGSTDIHPYWHHGHYAVGWNNYDPRWDARQGNRYDPQWGYWRYDPRMGYWHFDPRVGHYRWDPRWDRRWDHRWDHRWGHR